MIDITKFGQAPSGLKAEIFEEIISILNPLELNMLYRMATQAIVRQTIEDMEAKGIEIEW